MKCNNCGNKIRLGDDYCTNCGAPINWMNENSDRFPEETHESGKKKAAKWLTWGIVAVMGIAAAVIFAVIATSMNSGNATSPTDVAEETEVTTQETTTQPTTTQPATTQPTTTQPETRPGRGHSRDEEDDIDFFDDYEDNGVADDMLDYLRTRGYETRDSIVRGGEQIIDSITDFFAPSDY